MTAQKERAASTMRLFGFSAPISARILRNFPDRMTAQKERAASTMRLFGFSAPISARILRNIS